MTEAFVCDGVRTPIGRYGGALSAVRPDDLAALPIRALMERNTEADWQAVDDVVLGCANQAGEDNRNVARMALLLAGMPESVPGATINRLCGSGMDALGGAARAIKAGEADLMIAGGVESMSRAPFVMAKAETAFSRAAKIEDTTLGWRFVNILMKERHGIDSMPETAENVAEEYQIGRADQDLHISLCIPVRQLGDAGSLSDAVDADHQDNQRGVAQGQAVISSLDVEYADHLPFQDGQCLGGFADALISDALLQSLKEHRRGAHANVSRDQ